ncbi:ATP-binding cassette domain-containing protein [Hymenobacter lutimineralis]|uniref:ATP-binding cassette domain-containing protein n=1 Tax=Hymenobacter lutimineralis TaxID=2606448 RepID=A0A5D6V383_9BACT|nr:MULTISPECIES: ATP-binding cassette domain-containing protein [Hymenobacter]QIX63031.1 ATP-binding cassette domain-containing protein [Hymenobacter sp. BT18]TYZ10521.1 ATP-binding cassette domain-containing protein [Hymenobacter lutimineralis]
MAVIELHDAYIMQEVNTVLQKVSFRLEKGEFAYLVGRTGSGKSSLLKTLYADLPLGGGTGTVADVPLQRLSRSQVPQLRRKLGIIFQDFQLLFDRSVADNLLFVLNATGWTGKARKKQRISEVLMRVGLANVAGKMPHQLSGGEQQRVVIARALLNEPLLLLADEPTGNLDPDVADSIMRLFVEINHAGTAVLMATHNYPLLRQYPQRILQCKDGHLLDSATANLELSGR